MANSAIGEVLEFKGKVESVRFFSDNTSWGACIVSVPEEIPFSKVSLDYDIETNMVVPTYTVVVAGKMPEPVVGNTYNIIGQPVHVAKYKSDQYEVVSMFSEAPKTVEDQKAFLSSLCTEKQVESMLSVYPDIVDMVIQGKGEEVDLGLLKGIGEVRWGEIKEKIVENFAISDILALLVPAGISFSKIKKLLNDEPNPQILKQKLLKNPYVIANISGISFKTADKIAVELNSGLRESEERLVAFIRHFLEELGNGNGDTWTTIEEIRNGVIKNVPEVEKYLDVLFEKEKENSKLLYIEDEKVGLKYYYFTEKYIWDKLVEISKSNPLEITKEAIQEGIAKAEQDQGFQFTEEQRNIILQSTTNNFVLLTGKAGTGKSTLSRGILNVYDSMGYSIAVCSLSAKAAVRATEVTGYSATTIHRLLGATGINEFSYNEKHKLGFNVVLCDESSMINAFLFKNLIEAINTDKTKVIFVGDSKQIPPISAGNTFSDLLEQDNYKFEKFELTKIQRQASDSAIITDANLIREGISPIEVKESKVVHGANQDLYYLFRSSREDIFSIAISSYIKSVEEKGLENVVLLSPRKQGCLNSTKELNKVIQNRLNSENANNKFVYGEKEFRIKDKVIHVVNNYEKMVFNGETGIVSKIEPKGVVVQYPDKSITYKNDDMKDLELAHALTIHKVQGSEYQDVIICLDNSHFMLLSNQLIYTGITRGRSRVMVIAEPFAFDKGLEEDKTIRSTWTKGFKDGVG
jgi:exodeoxyribonuclease V alpha subunit